jgi:type IV pilus assembly protein PilC
MRYFIYKVKDETGRPILGIGQGINVREIKIKVNRTKYFFISAKRVSKKKLFKRKVKFETLIMFTHRLTSLVEAGVPILQAMDILWRQSEDEAIQLVASHMKARLEEGNKISDSMAEFPNIFSPLYRALIRVGEMSGVLISVLRKLTEYLEYKQKMIARTKRAVAYPVIVVIFSFLVMMGMFIFVVPTFEKLLTRLDVELPGITKFVLNLSNAIRNPFNIVFILVVLIGGYMLLKSLLKNKRFALMWDTMIIKIPYFGSLMFTMALSQMFRSLSILLGAGLPIVESMEVSAGTAGNRRVTNDMVQVQSQVEQGSSLYDAFKHNKNFPIMLKEMIGVGESSGMLVPVLERVTQHFDEEVDYELNKFLTFLEPALIVLVGGIVVVVLISVYMPIMSIWSGLMN